MEDVCHSNPFLINMKMVYPAGYLSTKISRLCYIEADIFQFKSDSQDSEFLLKYGFLEDVGLHCI